MTITPEQRKDRQEGLGGSDALAYCGEDPHKSPIDLYREKTEPLPAEVYDPRRDWGNRLEPVIRDWLQDELKRPITLPPEKAPRHAKYPFLIGHLDGVLFDAKAPEGVEIKSADKLLAQAYGEVETDKVPIRHVCQVMHYMMVMPEIRQFHIAVLLGGNDSRHYVVQYDADLAAVLLARALRFWEQVVTRTVPAAKTFDDCKYLWPRSQEIALKATDHMIETIQKLEALRKRERTACHEADELEVEVKSFMGTASQLIGPGVVNHMLATWRSQERNIVNLKALEGDHPDLVAQYRHTSSHRVFRLR